MLAGASVGTGQQGDVPMEEDVKAALIAAGFKDYEIRLETTQMDNVSGFVISTRFAGKGQVERQETLWADLAKYLPPEKFRCIVLILTLTPDEVGDDVRAPLDGSGPSGVFRERAS